MAYYPTCAAAPPFITGSNGNLVHAATHPTTSYVQRPPTPAGGRAVPTSTSVFGVLPLPRLGPSVGWPPIAADPVTTQGQIILENQRRAAAGPFRFYAAPSTPKIMTSMTPTASGS